MLVLYLKWWYLFWTERELIMSYELWMMNVSTEDEIMITILKMTENSSFITHHSSFWSELWIYWRIVFGFSRPHVSIDSAGLQPDFRKTCISNQALFFNVAAVGASTHGKWERIFNSFLYIACRGLIIFFLIKRCKNFIYR
jgi:hypothetical protein